MCEWYYLTKKYFLLLESAKKDIFFKREKLAGFCFDSDFEKNFVNEIKITFIFFALSNSTIFSTFSLLTLH